jgi:hypothetical protein
MPEADKAARIQRFIKRLGGCLARYVIEVDE